MAAIDQNRPIQLKAGGLRTPLLLSTFQAAERLSEPFHYVLSTTHEQGDLLAADFLGRPATVTCGLAEQGKFRVFHGLVTDFTQLGYGRRGHEYELTLRPWFWFLTRTADCRVFQGQSVPEIFAKLVKDLGFSDFRNDLKRKYSPLAYCVQYRETAFNFLSRLLEQEGIYYYFEHTEQKHTMVLVDDSSHHQVLQGYAEVPYIAPGEDGIAHRAEHLYNWTSYQTVRPGKFAGTDYDFKQPKTSLLHEQARAAGHMLDKLEIFDYPLELPAEADTADKALIKDQGPQLAKTRLEELQALQTVARGQGTAIGLTLGRKFKLKEHPRDDFNGDYLLVGTTLTVQAVAEETGGGDDYEVNIAVDAIPLRTQFRPARVTPKPVVQGAQTATVVGKAGEEIDTDKHGRIKVQFHWDRQGKKDENSSCRVRVAQQWAGKNWGAIYLPRIGQEVIVSFLEGDPDRPIVTGSVYNGEQEPPYALPANATQSGVKTRSAKEGTPKKFNEIRFEDKKGAEHLHIHAERDFALEVEHNASWKIGLDENDARKNGDGTDDNGGNLKIVAGGLVDMQVQQSLNVKVDKDFVKFDAAEKIEFVTGKSKIVMLKDGTITIDCVKLKVTATEAGEIAIDCMKLEADAKDTIALTSKNKGSFKATSSLTLDGTAKLEAKAVQVKIDADANLQMKANAMAKLEATGMLDLSASGIASLKGALTKIG